ncbi:MAG: hypothetical protein IID05_11140 [Gemmatimonadetes bacterium]|nr:hypothetical protein [Gemmatimonadota bacterium]
MLIMVVFLTAQFDLSPRTSEMTRQPSDSSVGALEGFVRWAGEEIPSATTVENATDPEVCGRQYSLEDLVVSPENRGIRYAIAALVGVPMDRVPGRSPKRVILDNRECQFDPHVSVATVGDTIVSTNGDPTLHTAHYYGVLRGNISLPASGMVVSRVARLPGMISVLCDVHGWMKAFIRVGEHPYHAVTDDQGHFRISEIPPGSYTLELWHEKLGTQQVSVRIEPGTTSRIELEYTLAPEEQ